MVSILERGKYISCDKCNKETLSTITYRFKGKNLCNSCFLNYNADGERYEEFDKYITYRLYPKTSQMCVEASIDSAHDTINTTVRVCKNS